MVHPPNLNIGFDDATLWEVVPYIDFSYGLDVATSIDNMDVRALRVAKNVILDPSGGFKKRNGMAKVNDTAYDSNPIKRLFDFQRWSGDVFNLNASGTTLRLEDGTALKTDFANVDFAFEVMSDKCLFVNGDDFYETDGTGAGTTSVPLPTDTDATLTEVKRCKGLAVYRDRLWAYNDPQSPHSLYYSQTGRYDYFKSTDMIINLLAGNADPIVYATSFLGGMAIFRQANAYSPGTVWALFGDPVTDKALFRVMVEESTVSGRAIALVGDMLIYPGLRNVYGLRSLDKDNPSAIRVGDQIAPLIKDAYNKENMVAIGYDGKYYLAFQQYEASGCNDSVLVMDTRVRVPDKPDHHGAWVLWEGIYVNDWLVRDGVLYYADAINGYVRKFVEGQYNDDGTPIEMDVETGLLHLLGGGGRQFVLRLFIRAPQPAVLSSVNVTVTMEYHTKSWTVDLNESFIWGVSEWGKKWGWTDLIRKALPVGLFGDRLKVKFQNVNDEPCHIYGFGVMVQKMTPWASQMDVEEV